MDDRVRSISLPTSRPRAASTALTAREVPDRSHAGVSNLLTSAGPAVVVSVAYMDPGNFATNIQADAKYGYALLWVVVLANVVAMMFQAMSAKLGIITGKNLAQLCRERFPIPVVLLMWGVSEIAAMATDLAEFLGGAISLALLFHLPLLAGMTITALVTYSFLMLENAGLRFLEVAIGLLVGVIGLCYLAELFIAPVVWQEVLRHTFLPRLPDKDAVPISVGIIGATVMPHTLFLHSGLTQGRVLASTENEPGKLLRRSNIAVVMALSIAGVINMAMVTMAASAFHSGHREVAQIEEAYYTLVPLLGGGAAGIFLLSLIASGISSSAVGTMSGQMIMQGFVGFRVPLWIRRAATMFPSLAVVALGVNATHALIFSQVVLSLALPFPMAALLWFMRCDAVMGGYRTGVLVTAVATLAALAVLSFNLMLVLQMFGVGIPGVMG